MLINNVCNINRALKNRSLMLFERYSLHLVMLLNALWKKRLIIGYNIKKEGVKIYLKYNRGIPILKSFLVESKPSRIVFKKLKSNYVFSLISNSWMNLCVSNYKNPKSLHGIFFFRLII